MKGIAQDPQTNITNEIYAVIYTPKKRGRGRYPENCVTEVIDFEAALAQSDPEKGFHAAKVFGPSRSSEGCKLYYLIEWID